MNPQKQQEKSTLLKWIFPVVSVLMFLAALGAIYLDQKLFPIPDASPVPDDKKTENQLIIIVSTNTPTPLPSPTNTALPVIIPTVTPEIPRYTNLRIGDTISFGHYEQDGIIDNGPEPIEWFVLNIQNGHALLISKYGLDSLKYNEIQKWGMTWENCTLRSWLNHEFFDYAFTPAEQSRIAETLVENPRTLIIPDDGQSYWVDAQNSTRDKIFLLNNDETERYFPKNDPAAKRCRVTPYAIQRNVFIGNQGTAWWWLRSPGQRGGGHAAFIDAAGYLQTMGWEVAYEQGAIRPVFWLIQ